MEELVVTITTRGRTFTVATERELVSLLFALGLVSESTLYAYFVQFTGV